MCYLRVIYNLSLTKLAINNAVNVRIIKQHLQPEPPPPQQQKTVNPTPTMYNKLQNIFNVTC